MLLLWLAVAVAVFFLVRMVISSDESEVSLETSFVQGSAELLGLVRNIKGLRHVASPPLESVRDLAQRINTAYPKAITSLQQKQVECKLRESLEDKRIMWSLRANDVLDHAPVFSFGYRELGGYWIECR